MIYGKLYRKDGSILRRVKYQILGASLYAYLLRMKNQHKIIIELKEQLKIIREQERLKVANLIDDGIDHSITSCQGNCEPHIITEFIRALEDKPNGN